MSWIQSAQRIHLPLWNMYATCYSPIKGLIRKYISPSKIVKSATKILTTFFAQTIITEKFTYFGIYFMFTVSVVFIKCWICTPYRPLRWTSSEHWFEQCRLIPSSKGTPPTSLRRSCGINTGLYIEIRLHTMFRLETNSWVWKKPYPKSRLIVGIGSLSGSTQENVAARDFQALKRARSHV